MIINSEKINKTEYLLSAGLILDELIPNILLNPDYLETIFLNLMIFIKISSSELTLPNIQQQIKSQNKAKTQIIEKVF